MLHDFKHGVGASAFSRVSGVSKARVGGGPGERWWQTRRGFSRTKCFGLYSKDDEIKWGVLRSERN